MKALYRRALAPLSREAREEPGKGAGSRIDISMFRSAAAWMASPLMLTALGERVSRRGNTHQFFAPASVYPTADGYVYVAVGNDRQWEAITRLPGFEALADPAYQRNAGRIAGVERLNQRLADCTRTLRAGDLMAALNSVGVPVAKVNGLQEVLAEPLLNRALARARDPRTGTEVILPPLADVSDEGRADLSFPPRLGEHNEMIYGELLGCSPQKLADLRGRGVI
jgi:formyl-CoA transferase